MVETSMEIALNNILYDLSIDAINSDKPILHAFACGWCAKLEKHDKPLEQAALVFAQKVFWRTYDQINADFSDANILETCMIESFDVGWKAAESVYGLVEDLFILNSINRLIA